MQDMPPNTNPSEAFAQPELTRLLNRMQAGDRAAADQVIPLIYGELHRIASREMKRERQGHPLQTTALIHEAYSRLAGAGPLELHDRGHFFAIASMQMRRILVDMARAGNAQRRGGSAPKVSLDKVQIGVGEQSIDLLLLDEALKELERVDPRAAKVVELRFFGGYTDKEVVQVLGVALSTVRRDWEFARIWLFDRMGGDGAPPGKAEKNGP